MYQNNNFQGQGFQQQGFNGGYPQQGMGYNYGYQAPVMTNALSPEEIKELRKANATNVIPQVTKAEVSASKCTHRDPQRNCFATVENGDGTVTCQLCGETFTPVAYTRQQADDIVADTINIAQTTKMNFLDMSPSAVAEYFKMIPLLKRLPQLYEQSLNNFNKYDNGMQYQQNGNNNFFNMFSALTSPQGMYGQPMGAYQQPVMQGYQQPMYGQPMGAYQQPFQANGPVPMQQNAFYAQQPNQMQAATVMQQQAQTAPNQPNVPPTQPAGKPEVKNVINA